jgi:hypothetical protein
VTQNWITAEVDSNRLQLAMGELRSAMLDKGMDASNIVSQNTRALARTLTNIAPPLKGPGGSSQKIGLNRIEKELKSLFTEVEPLTIDEVGSLHGIRNIDTFLTQRDGGRLNLLWDNIDPLGAHMPEFHRKYRSSRGRIPYDRRAAGAGTWRARVVVPQGSRAPYIKAVQARLGRAKCSIGLVGMMLADNYPTYIMRHKGSVQNIAHVEIQLDRKNFPGVAFSSRAPGIGQIRNAVQSAVTWRAKAVERRVRLVLTRYKDWRTVRANARAHRWDQPEGLEGFS